MKRAYSVLLAALWPLVSSASTDTYVCSYQEYNGKVDGKRYTERDKTNNPSKPFGFTLVVDSSKGTAYIIGNHGSDEVMLIPGKLAITFVEVTQGGNVMTTTITPTMQSVHSRHTILSNGDFLPSQYYGQCVHQ